MTMVLCFLSGTQVGSFNDRMRDGAMGGSPFSQISLQGFVTGLALQPNGVPQGDPQQQKAALLEQTDWLRFTLAGNLQEYIMQVRCGDVRRCLLSPSVNLSNVQAVNSVWLLILQSHFLPSYFQCTKQKLLHPH